MSNPEPIFHRSDPYNQLVLVVIEWVPPEPEEGDLVTRWLDRYIRVQRFRYSESWIPNEESLSIGVQITDQTVGGADEIGTGSDRLFRYRELAYAELVVAIIIDGLISARERHENPAVGRGGD